MALRSVDAIEFSHPINQEAVLFWVPVLSARYEAFSPFLGNGFCLLPPSSPPQPYATLKGVGRSNLIANNAIFHADSEGHPYDTSPLRSIRQYYETVSQASGNPDYLALALCVKEGREQKKSIRSYLLRQIPLSDTLRFAELKFEENITDSKRLAWVRMGVGEEVASHLVQQGYFKKPSLIDLTVLSQNDAPRYFFSSRGETRQFEVELTDLKAMGITLPQIAFEGRKISLMQHGLELQINANEFSDKYIDRMALGKFIFPITAKDREKYVSFALS